MTEYVRLVANMITTIADPAERKRVALAQVDGLKAAFELSDTDIAEFLAAASGEPTPVKSN